jgi:hypothetical protein
VSITTLEAEILEKAKELCKSAKILHESIRDNDEVLKGLNIGSKKNIG